MVYSIVQWSVSEAAVKDPVSVDPLHCVPLRANFFFGRTFDLVSQNSINYACVVKVRHTPNARAYVAVSVLCSIMPNPTPTTPTNFRIAQDLKFQHADCTSRVHKKCPTVLYASFISHPHWPYITACCLHSAPSSSNVTAGGSQYVICAKYE